MKLQDVIDNQKCFFCKESLRFNPMIMGGSSFIKERGKDYYIFYRKDRWSDLKITFRLTLSDLKMDVIDIQNGEIKDVFDNGYPFDVWMRCEGREGHNYNYVVRALINDSYSHFKEFEYYNEWASCSVYNIYTFAGGFAEINLASKRGFASSPIKIPFIDLNKFTPQTLEHKLKLYSKFA